MDDLNYLFHRQQVERSRADTAESEEARVRHEQLAHCYEVQIDQATSEEFKIAPGSPPTSASPQR